MAEVRGVVSGKVVRVDLEDLCDAFGAPAEAAGNLLRSILEHYGARPVLIVDIPAVAELLEDARHPGYSVVHAETREAEELLRRMVEEYSAHGEYGEWEDLLAELAEALGADAVIVLSDGCRHAFAVARRGDQPTCVCA
jgi:sirohydrochlorin ferrochelatase